MTEQEQEFAGRLGPLLREIAELREASPNAAPQVKLLAVSIGAIIYYVVIQAVVSLSDINTNYLKLISAVIVAVFLAIPYWKGRYFTKTSHKGGPAHA